MAHLNEILTAILIDITKAQHTANVFSRRLGKQYKDDKLLRNFPLPNALINSVDINLHYGVSQDPTSTSDISISDAVLDDFYPSVNLFLKLGRIFATFALNAVSEEIGKKELPGESSEREKRLKILKSLRSEKICEDLGDEIGESLNNWYRLLQDNELDGEGKIDEAISTIRRTISGILLSNLDLKQQFMSEEFTDIFDNYQSDFWQQLEANFKKYLIEYFKQMEINNLLRKQLPNDKSLNIFIDAERLKGLPETAIQTIDLKINLQSYKCVITKPGDEEEFLPEA